MAGRGKSRSGRGRRRGGSGGFGGLMMSCLALIVFLGAGYGIVKGNDIHSVKDGLEYLRSMGQTASKKTNDCIAGENCDVSSSGQGSYPGSGSGSAGSGSSDGGSSASLPEGFSDLSKADAQGALGGVKIADSGKVSYKRSEWKHWIDINGACNTRETVLIKQGKDVKTDPKTCRVISGTWTDPYSGQTITDPKKIDIDHVAPLGYVARNGGQNWSAEKKQQYANDVDTVLLAVSASENRSKSDKGPSEYMPPNKAYTCDYSKKWVDILSKYNDMSIPQKDKDALEAGLKKCSN